MRRTILFCIALFTSFSFACNNEKPLQPAPKNATSKLPSSAATATSNPSPGFVPTPVTKVEVPTPMPTPVLKSTTPVSETIPILEVGKGPTGELLAFTNPEARYGHEYLEQVPKQIEESEVVLAHMDGSAPKGIATNLFSLPIWSPSGEKFALQRYVRKPTADFTDLLVYDKTGHLMFRVDMIPSPSKLSWSPDEQSIIYASRFYNSRFLGRPFGWPPDSRYWIDGIYLKSFKDGTSTKIVPSGSGEFDHDPSVSPDGSKLVFITHRYGGQFSIRLSPIQPLTIEEKYALGSTRKTYELASGLNSLTNASVRFQWTPDSRKVVYMLEQGSLKGSQNSVYVVDVTRLPASKPLEIRLDVHSYVKNGPFTQLGKPGAPPVEENFHILDSMDLSPDGKQIVVGGPGSLFLSDVEGKNGKTVKLPKGISEPLDNVRWLSDNKQIAFVHKERYYYVNSDGSGLMEVPLSFVTRQVPIGVLISTGN